MDVLLLIHYHQAMVSCGLPILIKEPGKRRRYKTINEMHNDLKRYEKRKKVTFKK